MHALSVLSVACKYDFCTQILTNVLLVSVSVVQTEPVWTLLVVSPAYVTLATLAMEHSVLVSYHNYQRRVYYL